MTSRGAGRKAREPVSEKPAKAVRFGGYEERAVIRAHDLFVTSEAIHVTLGHKVWITRVVPSVEARADLDQRLERYASLLSKIGHQGVLGLVEVIHDSGRIGVVTRAPEGTSLREIIERRGAFELDEAVALSTSIARVTARLHRVGVAHLALAPEHIWIGADGSVTLGETFRAREFPPRIAEPPHGPEVRGPEDAYRSPEIVAGAAGSSASDVFSLGVIAYELIAGKSPWSGATPAEIARAIRAEPAPRLIEHDVSHALEQTILRALEKQSSLRFENAARLADELVALDEAGRAGTSPVDRALAAAGVTTSAPGERAPPLPRIGQHAVRMLGILAAMSVAMLGYWVSHGSAPKSTYDNERAPAEVRVLAHPWAEVFVDDARIDVTPMAKPIVLPAGHHDIVFKHPRAPDEHRPVDLSPGQKLTVDVTMAIIRPAPSAVDPTP